MTTLGLALQILNGEQACVSALESPSPQALFDVTQLLFDNSGCIILAETIQFGHREATVLRILNESAGVITFHPSFVTKGSASSCTCDMTLCNDNMGTNEGEGPYHAVDCTAAESSSSGDISDGQEKELSGASVGSELASAVMPMAATANIQTAEQIAVLIVTAIVVLYCISTCTPFCRRIYPALAILLYTLGAAIIIDGLRRLREGASIVYRNARRCKRDYRSNIEQSQWCRI